MDESVLKAAIKLLKVRSYSQHELVEKLLKQGYSEAVVGEVVEYVTKRGYLNDAALCDMLLERYAECSKYSLKETYIRLRRRGLPAALINEKLSNWDVNSEYQAALKIAQQYVNSKGQEDLHKIIRRLSAKGFKAPTVSKVLAALRDMSP